jgi:DNA-binding GntR family transcriptional regulator
MSGGQSACAASRIDARAAPFVGYGENVGFELPREVRLASASAADQVVATLRRLIIEGGIPAGARLRENQLAAGFDVSRQTVREAIHQLVHDGLVRHDRHRGAVVVELDEHDVADIYTARRVLETAGIDRLAEASDAAIGAVERAFEHLAAAASGGGWADVVNADIDFHRAITALAGSPRLVRGFETIAGELAFCLSVLRHVGQEERTPATIISEHALIARAVADRDADRARALLADHLELYAPRLAESLEARRETLVQD